MQGWGETMDGANPFFWIRVKARGRLRGAGRGGEVQCGAGDIARSMASDVLEVGAEAIVTRAVLLHLINGRACIDRRDALAFKYHH